MAQEKLDDLPKGKQNRNICATGFHDATAIRRERATCTDGHISGAGERIIQKQPTHSVSLDF